MTDQLDIRARHAEGLGNLTTPEHCHQARDTRYRTPSGWWLYPAALLGLLCWGAAGTIIYAAI